ncbi:SPOR domain-containing protein [Pantoea sp. SGAir0180]|uniref:SPOR domain-containing protein n=1 Tax=Pantoea stewartii TaxID=66269 RepID=UPI0006D0DE1F|nr:SPOR domain-containing protein [Pantoea stewartii]WHS99065.1 MAG: Cell division protein DamX [Pantoea stewartii]
MDEFKPDDELKPDASDRRPSRPRKSSSATKAPVSRQHVMMGVGILVLLLLVLGIGSALNGADDSKSASSATDKGTATSGAAGSGNGKNIDLSGSTAMSGGQNATGIAQPSTGTPNAAGAEPAAGATNAPRDISMPPVASTPTQAAPVETPANQQRITLPGDLNSALTNQQQQVDGAAQGAEGSSSLPTAPATVSGKAGAAASLPATGRQNAAQAPVTPRHTREPARTASKPAASEHKTHTTPAYSSVNNAPAKAAGSSATASKSVPGGNYTLQLSGASKAESLNAWAKKQNLSAYHVYKTTRNGQPWYVLVSGSYATPADAKRAVATLPAEVRAQNPWVKPVSQVRKEASQ